MRGVLEPLVAVEDQSISDLFLCFFNNGTVYKGIVLRCPHIVGNDEIVVQVFDA